MAPLNRIWETLRYGYLPLQGVGRHLSLKSLRPLAFAEACAGAAPAHFFQLRREISGIKQYAKYFYSCWPDRGQYRHVQVSCVFSL